MIVCMIGTRAQLIKMAPVMRELERNAHPYRLILTGQHKVTMPELLDEFRIQTKPIHIYDGPEITGIVQMGFWFMKCIYRIIAHQGSLLPKSERSPNYILVHGDTFSTLLGAIAGKLVGFKVAHVESGLRSFNWFHPFPEELTRLAVFRLADIAFCPNQWAASNLKGYRLEVVDCDGNTLLDSVNYAIVQPPHPLANVSRETYGVVSLHRFENIFNRKRLDAILTLLEQAAGYHPLVFVMHPATRKKLVEFGLLSRIEQNNAFIVKARMGYIPFLQMLTRAEFVITDGGSNQEELSYLNVPTLLMRKATERIEGLGKNVVISNYNDKIVNEFLINIISDRQITLPSRSVSATIVNRLCDQ
jgi:UDP-N-acetylglucosamine 2-epimerase (non-hydrolysing)